MTMTTDDDRFETMVARLNRLSVTHHHDAYADIAWDDPDMALRPDDDRLRLYDNDPLVDTDWWQALSPPEQSRFTIARQATLMKIGIQFENLLQRGLLKIAWREPNDSPLYRYAHHEVIEESQHSMMFQEYINRSGLPLRGLNRFWRTVAPRLVLGSAALDRPLFFVMVLGGEEPVDHQQRASLSEGGGHPLTERIMRIHVTEEARHISFAKHWLQREVPRLGRLRRFVLSLHFPITMGLMARIMLRPGADLIGVCGLTRRVVDQAYASEKGRAQIAGSAAKVQRLAESLGLMNPVATRLWKLLGVWTPAGDRSR